MGAKHILSKFTDDTELEEVFDAPDGFAVHHSWTSLVLRALSQGTLQISILDGLKFAFQKSKVEALMMLMPLLVSLNIERSILVTVSQTASHHLLSHQPFSVCKQEVWQSPSPVGSFAAVTRRSPPHTLKNFLECSFSTVPSSQQMSGRLKSPTRNKIENNLQHPVFPGNFPSK